MYLWKALTVCPCVYKYACYGGKSPSAWYISICQLPSSSCWVLSHPENSLNTVFAFFHILILFSSGIFHGLRLFSDLSKNTKNASFALWHYTLSGAKKSVHISESHRTLQLYSPLGSNSCKMAVRWGTYAVLLSTVVSFNPSVWLHGALCRSPF